MKTLDGFVPDLEALTNASVGIGRWNPLRFLLFSSGWKFTIEGVVEPLEVSPSVEAMFWDKNSSA
jgi:hypothetical protein